MSDTKRLLKKLKPVDVRDFKHISDLSVCEVLCRYDYNESTCPVDDNSGMKICDIGDSKSEEYIVNYFPKLTDIFKKL